jgi:hypothetical protein
MLFIGGPFHAMKSEDGYAPEFLEFSGEYHDPKWILHQNL